MPDTAELIASKLQTALRKQDSAEGALDSAISHKTKLEFATRYTEAHLRVKALRSALAQELKIQEPSIEEVISDGKKEKEESQVSTGS